MNEQISGGNSGIERRWGGTHTYNQQATIRKPFGNLGGIDGEKKPKLILKGTRCDDRNSLHMTRVKRLTKLQFHCKPINSIRCATFRFSKWTLPNILRYYTYLHSQIHVRLLQTPLPHQSKHPSAKCRYIRSFG